MIRQGILATTVVLMATMAFGREDDAAPVSDGDWRRPLLSRNQFPFALMFVYLTPDRAGALEAGRMALDVQLDYSNIIMHQDLETELVSLDLEYLRADVGLRRGFAHGIELGVSIPFYVYYGGFLDPFVEAFHDAFGLPNFLRGRTPHGQVLFEYLVNDTLPFRGEQGFGAIGDLSLHFKKTLLESDELALAFRSVLKLPTGDPESLSGSGATDLGVGAAFDRVTERWGFYANANYHFLGQPELFEAKNFFSFMTAVDFRLKPRLTVLAQFDHVRPFIEGELPIFNEAGQQIAIGLRWRYSDRFVYEWRFVEDLSDVSPDFTFAFSWGIRWPRSEP